jgi:hypothetical protein
LITEESQIPPMVNGTNNFLKNKNRVEVRRRKKLTFLISLEKGVEPAIVDIEKCLFV